MEHVVLSSGCSCGESALHLVLAGTTGCGSEFAYYSNGTLTVNGRAHGRGLFHDAAWLVVASLPELHRKDVLSLIHEARSLCLAEERARAAELLRRPFYVIPRGSVSVTVFNPRPRA